MQNKTQGMSRRSFLKGAVAAGATASAIALSGCSSEASSESKLGETGRPGENSWSATYDAVVVGAGFAGLATAITVASAGLSVAVLDNAPEEYAGGNSRVCGQLVWSPTDIEVAKKYFYEINEGYTDDIPEAMVDAFIREASENVNWIQDEIGVPMKNRPYPEYPAAPSMVAGQDCFCPEEGMLGAQLWTPMLDYALDLGVDFFYEHEARKLVLDEQGTVAGVLTNTGSEEKSFGATKGVAICSGGFENGDIMKSNYLPASGRPIGTPYNTGLGIKMCQAIGADLWHMHTAMIPYAFDYLPYEAPGFESNAISISTSASGGSIWLDKYGNRFMDETRDTQHGLGHTQILWEDANKIETPRIPLWVVSDEENVQNAGLFSSTSYISFHGGWKPSPGCTEEVELGWVLKADTIEELAEKMEIDTATLKNTIDRYNGFAATGLDEDFSRKTEYLRVLQPPFYAVQGHVALLNTDGGPRRNENAEVVDVWGSPIAKLYSAGEIGSIWPHHYQGSGNVGECLAFGRIAGRNIAAL